MHWWMLPVWFLAGRGLAHIVWDIYRRIRTSRERARSRASLDHAYVGPSAVADISDMGPYRTPTAPTLSSSYHGPSTDVVVSLGVHE